VAQVLVQEIIIKLTIYLIKHHIIVHVSISILGLHGKECVLEWRTLHAGLLLLVEREGAGLDAKAKSTVFF